MDEIYLCEGGNQHFWLPTQGKGMESYSCPMCGQLVYWSNILLKWVKPQTAGGKPIKGNEVRPQTKDSND